MRNEISVLTSWGRLGRPDKPQPDWPADGRLHYSARLHFFGRYFGFYRWDSQRTESSASRNTARNYGSRLFGYSRDRVMCHQIVWGKT